MVEIPSTGSRKLYNQDGQLYCTSAPNYNCLTAYNLTEGAFHLFTCGNNLQQPTPSNFYSQARVANMSVFPNPAQNQVTVQLPADFTTTQEHLLQLIDVRGKIVWSQQVASSQNNIDISALTSGIYFLQWKTPNILETTRLVIE